MAKDQIPPPIALRHKGRAFLYAFLILFFFYLMVNCSSEPDINRTKPKTTDPKKQKKCMALTGDICRTNKNCKKICDDLFSKNSHEASCLKLPEKAVFNFEKLFKTMKEEDIQDLDLNTLECLLDIDDTEFARAVKKLSRSAAKKFLIRITEEEDLAKILEEEDDEFNILKQAFSRAGFGYNLKDVLTDELKDDKSFFHIVAEEENTPAYEWVEEYVNEVCEESSSQCPENEKLGAYCRAFVRDYNSSELSEFLSSAELFEDDYRDRVESDGEHDWTVSGFEDFCDEEYSISSSGDSTGDTPADSPGSSTGATPMCPAVSGGICRRTLKVKNAILQYLRRENSGICCDAVTNAQLGGITSLDVSGNYQQRDADDCRENSLNLQAGDFAGLTSLTSLDLSNHCLDYENHQTEINKLSIAVFSGLDSITTINIADTDISPPPPNGFYGLRDTLTKIWVSDFTYCADDEPDYLSALDDNTEKKVNIIKISARTVRYLVNTLGREKSKVCPQYRRP